MNYSNTALLLIGLQNDYFHPQGILNSVFEDRRQLEQVQASIEPLVEQLLAENMLVIETPIQFTQDYSELDDPIGILKIIKDHGAFKVGTWGAQGVDFVQQYADQIQTLPGKRGLNCFSNTDLDALLKKAGVENVIIAGAVTSLCIDTAGREALDLGYKVSVLSDGVLARTEFEQDYYLNQIMPLYSTVMDTKELQVELA